MSDLGNKAIMAANIQYYMNIHKKSRKDVCAALGVNYTTFTDWVNAKKYPRIDKIEQMANYFGITKADLVEEPKKKAKSFSIPVLGSVAAGVPIEAIEDVLDYEEISEDMARQGEYIGLRVKGASMEPRMREGDVVIVRMQETVDNGEVAVVLVNGNDATIKKFYSDSNGVTLMPMNPSFDPLHFSPAEVETLPVRVFGKVVELRAKF